MKPIDFEMCQTRMKRPSMIGEPFWSSPFLAQRRTFIESSLCIVVVAVLNVQNTENQTEINLLNYIQINHDILGKIVSK